MYLKFYAGQATITLSCNRIHSCQKPTRELHSTSQIWCNYKRIAVLYWPRMWSASWWSASAWYDNDVESFVDFSGVIVHEDRILPLSPFDQQLREVLSAYIAATNNTQATICKEFGISQTVLSQWLSNKYRGCGSVITERVQRYLAQREIRTVADVRKLGTTATSPNKRPRHSLTPSQRGQLENAFAHSELPTKQYLQALADLCNLPLHSVTVWFQVPKQLLAGCFIG